MMKAIVASDSLVEVHTGTQGREANHRLNKVLGCPYSVIIVIQSLHYIALLKYNGFIG